MAFLIYSRPGRSTGAMRIIWSSGNDMVVYEVEIG